MSNLALKQIGNLASAFKIDADPVELKNVLMATAFKTKESISDAQLVALTIVANQYGLNPWTKEIYAYPDKHNGIVPVVGVDGWARIINDNPILDGIEFEYSEKTVQHKGKTCHEWVECRIYRKDRSRPIAIRERFDEVVRSVSFVTPWDTHPNRMHRHKTLIQCARIAFGFSGIYDQDEAERIVEKNMGKVVQDKPECPDELLNKATDEAQLGLENFRKYWKSLEKTDRALLSQHLKTLEGVCKEADDAKEKELSAEDVDFLDSYNEAENGTTI